MIFFVVLFVLAVVICLALFAHHMDNLVESLSDLAKDVGRMKDELERREGCTPDFFANLHATTRPEGVTEQLISLQKQTQRRYNEL